ncbi:MAG: UbiA family prenyltransferase [Hyphomicrobiaceae bacterium]
MTFDVALKLGRVSNLPTVWTNSLAAAVLVGGAASDWRIWILILAMSLFYTGGMFLNDAFDADIDAVERPERPIPSGQVTRQTVYALGFAMLVAGIVVVLLIASATPSIALMWPLLSAVALAGMIVFYNWHHKSNPLSPFIMGLCRVLVYVSSGLCFVAVLPGQLWIGCLILLCYLIGLTYVAKQENFGKVENMWPLAFLAAPLAYGLASLGGQPLVGLFVVLLAAWIGVALWLINRRQPGDIPRAVISLIAGISLLDAMLIASAGAVVAALVAVAGFGLTLFLQRFVSGT